MLELLIGLFLVVLCALPLVRIPSRALRCETELAFRMELGRLADSTFADIKASLYRNEVPWEDICHPASDKARIKIDEEVLIGVRKYRRTATVHSVEKKGKNGIEWRLATCTLSFQYKRKKPATFSYQVLLKLDKKIPTGHGEA